MLNLIALFILISTFIILLVMSKGKYDEYLEALDNKEYPLKAFLPIALFILEKINYKYSSKYDMKLQNKYSEITGKKHARYYMQIHMANKIIFVFLGLLFIFFISSILSLQQSGLKDMKGSVKIEANSWVERPNYGEGDKQAQLEAELQNGEVKRKEEFTLPIKEMPPLTEDQKAVAKAAENLTEDIIRDANKDLMNISSSLNFPKTDENFGNTGVKVVWKSGNSGLIGLDGTVTQPPYGAGNKKTVIQAILSKGTSQYIKNFKVTIIQSEIPRTDQQKILAAKNEIQKEIDTGGIIVDNSNKVKLPTRIRNLDDLKINWLVKKAGKDYSGLIFLGLGLGLLIALVIISDNDLNKKILKRRIKIQLDFPDFLNKLTLLINAGMTTSKAWIKISEDAVQNGPLYEEIALTVSEIRSGKAEIIAYEDFAQRCKVPEITKFVAVIEQNLKKGSKELVSVLKFQTNECWQIRKNAAKRLGEEASTKMLLPLMLMFLAIVLIVATPAIIAMQGF